MSEPDDRDSTSMAGSTHILVLMKASFDATPTNLRFNIGIELGQTVFLLAMLMVGIAWRRVMTLPTVPERAVFAASFTPVRVVSLAALMVGSVWLIERVVAAGSRQPNALIAQAATPPS